MDQGLFRLWIPNACYGMIQFTILEIRVKGGVFDIQRLQM